MILISSIGFALIGIGSYSEGRWIQFFVALAGGALTYIGGVLVGRRAAYGEGEMGEDDPSFSKASEA